MGLSSNAQMKFNQHNPYVSNADVFKLRELGIDLFDKPIKDVQFQNNVVELMLNKKSYDKLKASRTASISLGIAGLAVLIAGALVGQKRSVTTFPLKNDYINFGAITTAGAGIAFMINKPKHKLAKSNYLQKLKITKDQYNVLLPN